SNTQRKPNPFTGFDKQDNMPMHALTPNKPLHIVNMTLNLVKGENLAWQQRKAAPFTSTRLHTGSCRIGYRTSKEYGGHKGAITLGTAITVSGAAASPNMGYNSSPLLTIVMMLFNARLGWWLGNPRHKETWRNSGPTFGVRPFIDEMFGLTDDKNPWIYLSDGGHFENLGLYEAVLRRCSYIVVSDASCDPDFAYDDLGNAVRKIKIDLGISIDFTALSGGKGMPMSPTQKPTPDHNGRHCAIAFIRYSAIDGPGAPDGLLVYLKPSLSGDEPTDVRQYAAANHTFPHQTTADQFFEEAQFESYRRLGFHIIESICGSERKPRTLKEFAADAQRYAEHDCRTS
ncbi:MAG: patatin-like phospholipase family protein, partial [Bryobacteraceae bacterium]